MAYICQELETTKNIYGGYDCKKWATYENQSIFNDLAITKSDMVIISSALSGVFAVILAFTILAKAVKSM